MTRGSALPKRKILAVSHDIGGAQAIYPVIPKLRRKPNLHVDVIAGGFAQKVFSRLHPENTYGDWSDTTIDEYLDKNCPDLLLSSTSWKSALEQGFRNRALVRGIPSVVLIDFWNNYRLRWQHATYRFEDGPDHVCVMDARTAEALHQEGYPLKQIHVTGQPHLERCYQRNAQRVSESLAQRDVEVLFLTIALASMGLKDDALAPIRVICEALGKWYSRTNKRVSLTIRPHPHEAPPADFLDRIQEFAPPGVVVQLADRTEPIQRQLKRSDVVLGYITMGLFEARSFGKQAIAIKLADHPPELVAAMADAGIPLLPFDSEQIVSFLSQLGNGAKQIGTLYQGAAAAISDLCCDLVAKRSSLLNS
jgi:hypothetical protein